jgi:predicted helicase
MSAPQRDELLSWIKQTLDGDYKNINQRTMLGRRRGVDVPSLDAVLFLSALSKLT